MSERTVTNLQSVLLQDFKNGVDTLEVLGTLVKTPARAPASGQTNVFLIPPPINHTHSNVFCIVPGAMRAPFFGRVEHENVLGKQTI